MDFVDHLQILHCENNIPSIIPQPGFYKIENSQNDFIKQLFDYINVSITNTSCFEIQNVSIINEYNIHYRKNEKQRIFPSYSFVVFTEDSNTTQFVLWDIDHESYKYKLFENENNMFITNQRANHIVCFGGNYFNGIYNKNAENNRIEESNITGVYYIHLWENYNNFVNQIEEPLILTDSNIEYPIYKLNTNTIQNTYIQQFIFNNKFYNEVLYKKNQNIVSELIYQIQNETTYSEKIFDNGCLIHSKITPLQNPKYVHDLKLKYGENAINQIYNSELNLNTNQKIFSEIGEYNNIIDNDICSWLLNEVNNPLYSKIWFTNDISNSSILLDKIPYVFSLIIMKVDNILDMLSKHFNIHNIPLNIESITVEHIKHINTDIQAKSHFCILIGLENSDCFFTTSNDVSSYKIRLNNKNMIMLHNQHKYRLSNEMESIYVLKILINYQLSEIQSDTRKIERQSISI